MRKPMHESGVADKVRVGVFVGHFIPAYRSGGPIRSLAAITADRDSGVSYAVFTRDRDAGDRQPFALARPRELVEVRGRRAMYVDIERPVAYLRALYRFGRYGHDVYYFNSLWNRPFTLVPLALIYLGLIARRPVLLAPRGELLSGALGRKSRRKRVGLLLMRSLLTRLGVTLHCTSAAEVDGARRLLPGVPVELIPDAFDADESTAAESPSEAAPVTGLRVCYFSRIHPHKNLAGAISALGEVPDPVHLRVIGPVIDDGYHQHCRALAAGLPAHIRVEFVGSIPHEETAAALSWGHVLLLPTKGENFGHAIREGMAAGLCPVLRRDAVDRRGAPCRRGRPAVVGHARFREAPLGAGTHVRAGTPRAASQGARRLPVVGRQPGPQPAADGRTLRAPDRQGAHGPGRGGRSRRRRAVGEGERLAGLVLRDLTPVVEGTFQAPTR
ncbi:glycosyltransferase [Micromonospora sp. PLK6-60]|uniref:glycosyltransferase family 4 protein n=1 Tax=Micromonospora sp. PLK6-60 TaxID=2873383 RepID=UPI001CA6D947|nr:glycosyltransferase [Micromonospora sp. PLK6-60]MBY8874822.1 glycosyltransferase [Micromonospora sp. PLK6-60]